MIKMEVEKLPAQVFGLAGICQIFGVGMSTAQIYKKTWLRPAITQNGRKIIIDTAEALKLFEEQGKKKANG